MVVVCQPHAPAAFTPKNIPGTHVDRRAMVWSEGNMSLKNPGTVRLVAQRLNHYATPGPAVCRVSMWNKTILHSSKHVTSSSLPSKYDKVLLCMWTNFISSHSKSTTVPLAPISQSYSLSSIIQIIYTELTLFRTTNMKNIQKNAFTPQIKSMAFMLPIFTQHNWLTF
jgi:hypothetical protein